MADGESIEQSGWFRSPLAAGMLSGVLAGMMMLARWHIEMCFSRAPAPVSTFAGVSLRDILDIPWNTLLCCGPAIMHRRWRLTGSAFLCALILLVVGTATVHMRFWFIRIGLASPASSLDAWWCLRAAIMGSISGFALMLLYGIKPYAFWAPAFGACAGMAVLICSALLNAVIGAVSTQLSEAISARTMFIFIASVVIATAPALAIEWDLKKRTRQSVVLSQAPRNVDE